VDSFIGSDSYSALTILVDGRNDLFAVELRIRDVEISFNMIDIVKKVCLI
jgi:hypothetical protein